MDKYIWLALSLWFTLAAWAVVVASSTQALVFGAVGCALEGSTCGGAVACCPGATCQRVGNNGTRYDWQCR